MRRRAPGAIKIKQEKERLDIDLDNGVAVNYAIEELCVLLKSRLSLIIFYTKSESSMFRI